MGTGTRSRVSWARTAQVPRRLAWSALAILTLGCLAPGRVTYAEPCTLARMAELPVTMLGTRPTVHAAINGTDALFLADSGAFFNTLTPAAAEQLKLRLEPAPYGFSVIGVGGVARTWLTTVKTFTIFNLEVPKVIFIVAGNDLGDGVVGLLGQNVFRLGDVEYDLANGAIRLLRPKGDCKKSGLAYWANAEGKPYSVIDIDFATAARPHNEGTAYLNGKKIRVLFDTGSPTSLLTLEAAKRAGITPDSPGVSPAGPTFGIGRRVGQSWLAPFVSFKIGDEEIRNARLRIADVALLQVDMLVGADFFLSHRIYVATSQRRLYFTYNGGPVFNLTPTPVTPSEAPDPPGAPEAAAPAPAGAGTAAAAANEPQDAGAWARRGSASAARQDYEHALADLTRACELAPTESSYFYQRGLVYWSSHQYEPALADFGQALQLAPDDVPALVARAGLRASHREPGTELIADLEAADRAAPKEADVRLQLGELYEYAGLYPAAVSQYSKWIDSHNRDDIQMPHALNSRCWARALAGQELDLALTDCNNALRLSPNAPAILDSRGLVYLRQGNYDRAIADYDAALRLQPKIAWSLYGRGLSRLKKGQTAAGQADIAAATALSPKIAENAARHGISP
jgi:tetratricopeptide (TPR) repeat protein/predicted aspartyl protease